ncbi:MAG: type IX secretion system membrane protein PorP/SprF [Brumimicrobium sp.]
MIKLIISVFFSLVLSTLVFGQNRLNITQYMMHQPILNMASIAGNDNINAAAVHRQQWVGFEGAPASSFFSFNSPIKTTNLHVGGIASFDRLGSNSITNVDLGVAYRMQLNTKNFLSLSLKGGVTNTNSDYSTLNLSDQNDPEFPATSISEIQPDFGFSAYFFSRDYYVGFAIPSLFRNANYYPESQLVVPQDFHYFTTAGYRFSLNESFKLGFSTLLKGVLGSPLQADLNTQLLYNDFLGFGVSYRTSNDLATILSVRLMDKFTISYSYDFGFSELSRYHSNTHEIMLTFDTPSRELLPITSPRF